MQIRIFTLKFNPISQSFPDEKVREYLHDKRVISIHEHFFTINQEPYIALVITYEQGEMMQPENNHERGKRDSSWKELLTEEDQPLFNQLREWRRERCKKDGVPPYVVCNNKQLAQIAVKKPQSKEELASIEGIGPAKIKKYSDTILSITKSRKNKNES